MEQNPALPLAQDAEQDDLEPSQDELRNIDADEQIKRKPTARDMTYTSMPGNDSTYPAL